MIFCLFVFFSFFKTYRILLFQFNHLFTETPISSYSNVIILLFITFRLGGGSIENDLIELEVGILGLDKNRLAY